MRKLKETNNWLDFIFVSSNLIINLIIRLFLLKMIWLFLGLFGINPDIIGLILYLPPGFLANYLLSMDLFTSSCIQDFNYSFLLKDLNVLNLINLKVVCLLSSIVDNYLLTMEPGVKQDLKNTIVQSQLLAPENYVNMAYNYLLAKFINLKGLYVEYTKVKIKPSFLKDFLNLNEGSYFKKLETSKLKSTLSYDPLRSFIIPKYSIETKNMGIIYLLNYSWLLKFQQNNLSVFDEMKAINAGIIHEWKFGKYVEGKLIACNIDKWESKYKLAIKTKQSDSIIDTNRPLSDLFYWKFNLSKNIHCLDPENSESSLKKYYDFSQSTGGVASQPLETGLVGSPQVFCADPCLGQQQKTKSLVPSDLSHRDLTGPSGKDLKKITLHYPDVLLHQVIGQTLNLSLPLPHYLCVKGGQEIGSGQIAGYMKTPSFVKISSKELSLLIDWKSFTPGIEHLANPCVMMVNNISNEYTGPYFYQDSRYESEINIRFRNLWHDFSWFNLNVGHTSLDRFRSTNYRINQANILSRHDLNFFHVDAWRDFPNSDSILPSYNRFVRGSIQYFESELSQNIRDRAIYTIDRLYSEHSEYQRALARIYESESNIENTQPRADYDRFGPVLHGFLVDRMGEMDRNMSHLLNRMNEVVEELSHVLATHNITVTPALDGNPLTIGNYADMDESSIQELTNTVRDLDNSLRSINNNILVNLNEIIAWVEVTGSDPRLRGFWGSISRDFSQVANGVYVLRSEYFSRRYRFLVIYRIVPDLARRYTHFNLFDQ